MRGVRSVPLAVAIGVTIEGLPCDGRRASHGYSLAGPSARAERTMRRPFASRTGVSPTVAGAAAPRCSGPAGSMRTPLVEPASATHQPPFSSQTSAWRRLANVPSTRMSAPSPLPTT